MITAKFPFNVQNLHVIIAGQAKTGKTTLATFLTELVPGLDVKEVTIRKGGGV